MSLEDNIGEKPVLNRDLQTIIGEQIIEGIGTKGNDRHYVTDGLFNILVRLKTI